MNIDSLLVAKIKEAKKKRNKMLFIFRNQVSSEVLQETIQQLGIPTFNLSLALSEQLRVLSINKRPLEAGKILRMLINKKNEDVIFLEHIEYLFDTELKQNPIRLFENLSGNKTLIIDWPGSLQNGILIYATPEHPEYYEGDGSYLSYVIEI